MNAANHQESCRWLWQVISSGRFRLQVNKVGTHGTCGRFVSKTHAPIERDFNVQPHQFHLLDRYTAAPSTDIPCHRSDRWRTGVKPHVPELDPKL